jgi:hypothetical protein
MRCRAYERQDNRQPMNRDASRSRARANPHKLPGNLGASGLYAARVAITG